MIDSRTSTQQPEYSGRTLPEVTVVRQSPEAKLRPLVPVAEIKISKIKPIQN